MWVEKYQRQKNELSSNAVQQQAEVKGKTALVKASQAVRVGHGDGRPGRGRSDKEAPALTGSGPEIRALSCL